MPFFSFASPIAISAKRAVVAASVEAEFGAGGSRAFGSKTGAGDQFEMIVDAGRDAVHPADEGALTAADHAERIGPGLDIDCLAAAIGSSG